MDNSAKKTGLLRLSRCVFCQKTKGQVVTAPTPAVLQYLSSDKRRKISAQITDGRRSYVYHRTCYYRARKASLRRQQTPAESTGVPLTAISPHKTRSIVGSFNKTKCVFCQKASSGRTSRHRQLKTFTPATSQDATAERLQNHPDALLRVRLHGIDLGITGAKYHKRCRIRFFNQTRVGNSNDEDSAVSPIDSPTIAGFSDLWGHIKPELENGRAYSMTELAHILLALTGCKTKGSIIKRSLARAYSKEIRFIQYSNVVPTDQHEFICSASLPLYDIINQASSNRHIEIDSRETESPAAPNEVTCLAQAALALRREIQTSSTTITDISHVSCETATQITPRSLVDFLSKVTGNVNADTTRVLSIAQDVVAVATRRTSPKQLSLAMAVRHLTGSKQVIEMLCNLGHTCSYTELMRMETSFCSKELEKAHRDGVVIPSNMKPGHFTQMAMDNDDFQEETIDGKGTTHATTMVLYQLSSQDPPTSASDIPPLELEPTPQVNKDRRTTISKEQLGCLLSLRPYNKPKSRPTAPIMPESGGLLEKDEDHLNILAEAAHLDHEWALSRLKPTSLFELDIQPSIQATPSWTAYNVQNAESSSKVSTIGYCPMIDAKSSDHATVYTVLKMLQQIMKHFNQTNAVITFDWAIYHVAKEIQWDRPVEFSDTVIRMGGFHILMNFLATLGKMHGSSGLCDILVESGLFNQITVTNQIFSGKHYNRAVRAHKLTYEALYRLMMKEFGNWMKQNGDTDPFLELERTNSDHNDVWKMEEAIQDKFEVFVAEGKRNQTFKFWWDYVEAVQVMLAFIRAERSGNWKLHIASAKAMLPLFHAYDRQNYAKWLPVYITDMMALPEIAPEVQERFAAGEFAINRTGNAFAALPTDQVLEQTLNRDSKSSGGLIGFSNNVESRSKWFLTSHIRAQLLATVREMCEDEHTSPQRHREDCQSRTTKDEKDVQSIIDLLHRYNGNPFKANMCSLINLATGLSPTCDVASKIVSAPELGSTQLAEFVTTRLLAQESRKPFFDPLPRLKIPSFSAKPAETKTKKQTLAPPKQSLARLLIMAKDRDIGMESVLDYESGLIPLSLFNPDSTIRKTVKSQLLHSLEGYSSGAVIVADEHEKAMIIDGMSLVQTLRGSGTFGEYADMVLTHLLKEGEGCQRIDVVFDVYSAQSIKSAERQRRGEINSCSYKITQCGMKIPKNWPKYLSNIENKNELVRYLTATWEEGSRVPSDVELITSARKTNRITSQSVTDLPHLDSNHDEADTRLLLHAKDAFASYSTVIIRTVDTDVLVLAVHHLQYVASSAQGECGTLLMRMGTGNGRRYISVNSIVEGMPGQALAANVLAIHALTGCDTVSSLYRISKKKAMKTFLSGGFDVSELGATLDLPTATIAACEAFVANMYGPYRDLTEARYNLLASKAASEASLPPSKNAFGYHVQRANYQMWLWRQATQAIIVDSSPSSHGWTSELKPYTHDTYSGPELVVCRCGGNCSKNNCKCHKNKVPCTDACACRDCDNQSGSI